MMNKNIRLLVVLVIPMFVPLFSKQFFIIPHVKEDYIYSLKFIALSNKSIFFQNYFLYFLVKFQAENETISGDIL